MSDSELVLVETISMFRMRYAIRVPKGKTDWALDSVTMHEPENEIGQKHIDEVIISHRVVTEDEVKRLVFEDAEYLRGSKFVPTSLIHTVQTNSDD